MSQPFRINAQPTQGQIEKVQRALEAHNTLEILKAYIPGRLHELGWKEMMMNACCEYIREHSAGGHPQAVDGQPPFPDPKDIPVEEIVAALTPMARALVNPILRTELNNHIIDFIGEKMLD